MKDSNGAGEGPYTYYERADARFIIEGPGVHMDGGAEHLTRNEVSRLNMVFALGLQRSCTAGRIGIYTRFDLGLKTARSVLRRANKI